MMKSYSIREIHTTPVSRQGETEAIHVYFGPNLHIRNKANCISCGLRTVQALSDPVKAENILQGQPHDYQLANATRTNILTFAQQPAELSNVHKRVTQNIRHDSHYRTTQYMNTAR